MHPIAEYLKVNMPGLSQKALQGIETSFLKREVKKGDQLLRQGEVCRYLYFLTKGICRCYSLRDGHDVTTWFGFENEFITSFTSFFPKEPSYEYIEMLSDGVLYQISYDQLNSIKEQSLAVERAINHFSLLYTIQLEKRLFIIQTHSAAEKYQLILEEEPHLIQHIPNKHLASYLGITRETLSRIRSSIN